MALDRPAFVIVQAYNVRPFDCIFVTKENRGINIHGLVPSGMKILRYDYYGHYDVEDIEPISDDYIVARDTRNRLIDEARRW